MDQYKFTVESDGYVYFKIQKDAYTVKEDGIIEFTKLVQKNSTLGYEPMKFTRALWRHTTCKTTFSLCVDDFGVKYFSKYHAFHLVNSVKSQYQCTSDRTRSLLCDLNLEWHYGKGFVNVTMK